MALLTTPQLEYLRSELGTAYDEDDLQDRYDRLGSVASVAAEVIRQRLADLLTGPSSFAVTGVYSESNDATIRALQAVSARLESAADRELAQIAEDASGAVIGSGRLTRSGWSR